MPYGPIELLVVDFPGNQFSGEIAPALRELVENGTIRIIDILIVQKDPDGNTVDIELSDLSDDLFAVYDPVVEELAGLITHEDALALTAALPPNTTTGIMLFENVWAQRFADAVVKSKGEIVVNERLPRSVIDELIAAHESPAA